jgi:putative endonuclease
MYVCVYILCDGRSRTYVGATVNLARRLRQHNREIMGGAKYTRTWRNVYLLAYVTGFTTWRQALSFEWYSKRAHLKYYHARRARLTPHFTCPTSHVLQRLEKFLSVLTHTKFSPQCVFLNTCPAHVKIVQETYPIEAQLQSQNSWTLNHG